MIADRKIRMVDPATGQWVKVFPGKKLPVAAPEAESGQKASSAAPATKAMASAPENKSQ
jgi:hypothetical protein